MSFTKVTASNGSEYTPESVFTENGEVLGVIGQDKTPGLSVKEMQESIEAVVRKVAIPAHNALVDELSAETAAEDLGAVDKNGNPSNVQERIDSAVENDGTMPFVRLNADRVIETSTDGLNYEATGSSGHIIEDRDGVIMPQRSRLRFEGGTVEDRDGVTVVTAMQGEQGEQGERGERGEKGEQGNVGPAGPVMTPSISAAGVLSWELQETAIPPSPVSIRGPQGPQGVAGVQGVQGERGPAGVQGIAGPQGVMGQQGPTGPVGPTGPQGPTGATGATGPQGPAGKDGMSLYVEDVYPTLSALRSAFPNGNTSLYMVEEDANCYIWSEQTSAWVSVGKLQGPQGPKGETGATGPQGPAGETGPGGPQGIQGIQGIQGETGPEGPQGPAGIAGADGKSAYQAATEGGYTGGETDFNEALALVPTHIEDNENPHGVTKAQVGLGNVDNTADADKPVSTQQQAALDLKAPLTSPAFTGTPTAPTGAAGDSSTQIATTAFVGSAAAGAANAAKPKVATISVSTSWSGSGPYTQTVTVPGATASSKVDLQPDATILSQLAADGVTALYIVNDGGVFTAYAVGAVPTAVISMQATIEEVTV